MPLTAQHASGVTLDATAETLGDGVTWEQVYRVRPRAVLTCRGCGEGLHAKQSNRGLRFFAHDHEAECPLNGETVSHRLLKAALAAAVRDAGWHAELEVAGHGLTPWRADVLASSPDGQRRVAFEAQLSPIHPDDIVERTTNYSSAGLEVCWVAERVTPWIGHVPYLVVAANMDRHLIAELGMWRFEEWLDDGRPTGKWVHASLPLVRAVALICYAQVAPHALGHVWGVRFRDKYVDLTGTHDHLGWTAPAYIARASEHAAALDAWERKQQEEQEAWRRNIEALLERQQALIPPTIELLDRRAGRQGSVTTERNCDPFWAMGVPIKSTEGHKWVTAVVCPVASRVNDEIRHRLATVLVVIASDKERQRLQRVCSQRQQFHVIPQDSVPPVDLSQLRRTSATDGLVRQVLREFGWR